MSNRDPCLKVLAFCKWSSGGSSLLQMIIWRGWPLANDHPEGLASCKWLYGGGGLLKMIIWRGRPLANDICHPCYPSQLNFLSMLLYCFCNNVSLPHSSANLCKGEASPCRRPAIKKVWMEGLQRPCKQAKQGECKSSPTSFSLPSSTARIASVVGFIRIIETEEGITFCRHILPEHLGL